MVKSKLSFVKDDIFRGILNQIKIERDKMLSLH